MVVRVVVACALLSACGRFGFGADHARDTDAGDAAMPIGPLAITLAAPFATPSTTFVDIPAATLTLPPSVGTRWLLLTAAAIESPTILGVTVEARYLVDGVEGGLGGTQTSVPGHPGPWQSIAVIDGTTAPQQIQYQLRDESAAGATISMLDVVAIPLPEDAVHYARTDLPHDVTATTLTVDTPLSLGALQGDYVFLLAVNASDAPGTSDCYVAWHGPQDEVWMDERHQPRESWQSYLTVQRSTLDVADAHVTLYTREGSATAQVREVRAIAVRSDAFASVDHVTSATYATTASASATETLSLVPAASSASQFLYVGAIDLDENCVAGNPPDAVREAHFVIDGVDTVISHATDNCSYAASYGHIALLSAEPASLRLAYATANGTAIDHLSSDLLLLGLR